ncbi:MAG: UUP1 family membrane protein [Gammaproteobacteria bacterium]
MKKARIYTIALILFLISGSLMYYKVTKLGMPLIPSQQSDVWVVEAKLQFQASGGPAKAAFYIPNDPPGFVRLNEDFISSNYGLATNLAGENRKAEWAVRRAKGKQVLYYRMEFTRDSGNVKARTLPRPTYPQAPVHDDTMQAAINAVLNDVRAHSADIATFTRELLVRLNNTNPDQNISLINKVGHGSVEWVRQLVNILATARIPARIVYVLPLQDLVAQSLIPWIEVHNNFEWIAFDPVTGQRGFPRRHSGLADRRRSAGHHPWRQARRSRFSMSRQSLHRCRWLNSGPARPTLPSWTFPCSPCRCRHRTSIASS